MVAYFKTLLKSDRKQAWLDYYLINPSEKADKFIVDNQFRERIILLNKEKICPSANTSSKEFLRETMIMNVISLWKCWEVVSRTTKATLHGNCHNLAAKLPNVLLLVKYITEDFLFYEQLGQTWLQNNLQLSAFPDLFADGTARLATGLELDRYVYAAYGNWDKYKLEDKLVADNEEDGEQEDIERPPNNQFALYGVYD